MKKTAYIRDMTQGSIVRHLLAFALPLLIGNLFQQLYNVVDTMVVGTAWAITPLPPSAPPCRSIP